MFCKHCGNELPENANFCPVCGSYTSEIPQTPATQPTVETPTVDEAYEKERSEQGNSVLKFAILGLAFGMTFFLSALGLIFAIISRVKLNTYVRLYGETKGPATVGKHLGTAGLITSIILSALFALYVLIIVLMIITSF